jgi:membrane protease subunit HflC
MQRTLRILIAAIVVLAILAFMTTYTVRFTETAVVTTFGRADENSVKREPGLGFKWPYPIQSVTKYDTRARYTETRSETLATADSRQVIVQCYIVWQVNNPLDFFKAYGNAGAREADHVRQAEEALRARLRSALAETSHYKLTDLLSADAAGNGSSKLPELEQKVLTAVQGGGTPSGISIATVGIHSLELPESATEAVFKSMEASRLRIAKAEVDRGLSEAAAIRAKAEGDAKIILDFAARQADVIRAQGQQEAAKYLALQKEDPDLAVFLQNLRFMREALSNKKTTLILPLSLPGFYLMDPTVREKLGQGIIPKPGAPATNKPHAEGGARPDNDASDAMPGEMRARQ